MQISETVIDKIYIGKRNADFVGQFMVHIHLYQ